MFMHSQDLSMVCQSMYVDDATKWTVQPERWWDQQGESGPTLFCIRSSMHDHDGTVQGFRGHLPQIWLLVRPLKHSLPEIGAAGKLGRSGDPHGW